MFCSPKRAAIGGGNKQRVQKSVSVCVCFCLFVCVPFTRGHEWVLRLLQVKLSSLLGLLFFSFTRCKVLIFFSGFFVCLFVYICEWAFDSFFYFCFSFYDFQMLFFRVGTSTQSRLDVFTTTLRFALVFFCSILILLEFFFVLLGHFDYTLNLFYTSVSNVCFFLLAYVVMRFVCSSCFYFLCTALLVWIRRRTI